MLHAKHRRSGRLFWKRTRMSNQHKFALIYFQPFSNIWDMCFFQHRVQDKCFKCLNSRNNWWEAWSQNQWTHTLTNAHNVQRLHTGIWTVRPGWKHSHLAFEQEAWIHPARSHGIFLDNEKTDKIKHEYFLLQSAVFRFWKTEIIGHLSLFLVDYVLKLN